MNHRFAGKQKTLAVWRYPEVSVSDARARRDDARTIQASGPDPADPKPVDAASFEKAGREWLQARIDGSPGHLSRVLWLCRTGWPEVEFPLRLDGVIPRAA